MSAYNSFKAFYPFYLSQHRHPVCRQLHVLGSALVLLTLLLSVITRQWLLLVTLPLLGYGFAWTGHALFEHNQPATFKHPWYSLMGDWLMFWQSLTGQLPR